MTAPLASSEPGGAEPSDPVAPTAPPGPPRPSLLAIGGWLVMIGLAIALDGLVGGFTMVAIAAVLLSGLPTRLIGGLGVVLLVLAPVAVIIDGIPSNSEISPAIVSRSLVPHHLTFAGLVLVSAFALLDLAPHLRDWAAADRPAQDDGPPIGTILGALVVGAVGVAALLACRAVLGA